MLSNHRVKISSCQWWLITAFIFTISDAASIAVDEQLKQDVRRQTTPSSVEFPNGVRLTPVVGFISDEYIDPNNAGTSLFDSSGIVSTYVSTNFQVSEFLFRNGSGDDAPPYHQLSQEIMFTL